MHLPKSSILTVWWKVVLFWAGQVGFSCSRGGIAVTAQQDFHCCEFTYIPCSQIFLQETTTRQSNEVNNMEANKKVSDEPAIEPKNEAVEEADKEYAVIYEDYPHLSF